MASQTGVKRLPWETSLRYDALTIAWIVVALLASWGLKSWVEGRATVFTTLDANLSLSYPESWVSQTIKGSLLSIRNLQSQGGYKATFSVTATKLDPAANDTVAELAALFAEERNQELTAYRVLETSDNRVDDTPAVQILYAYVVEPGEGPFQTALPQVVRGMDVLTIHESVLYVFAFSASASTFSQEIGTFDAILESVSLAE